MKRKLIGVAVVAAIALVGGWNYNQSKNETQISELALANVEALASGEGSVTCCPDPGDTCVLSSGDKLRDQDEC